MVLIQNLRRLVFGGQNNCSGWLFSGLQSELPLSLRNLTLRQQLAEHDASLWMKIGFSLSLSLSVKSSLTDEQDEVLSATFDTTPQHSLNCNFLTRSPALNPQNLMTDQGDLKPQRKRCCFVSVYLSVSVCVCVHCLRAFWLMFFLLFSPIASLVVRCFFALLFCFCSVWRDRVLFCCFSPCCHETKRSGHQWTGHFLMKHHLSTPRPPGCWWVQFWKRSQKHSRHAWNVPWDNLAKEGKVLSRAVKTAKTVMKATPLKLNPPFFRHPEFGLSRKFKAGECKQGQRHVDVVGCMTSPSFPLGLRSWPQKRPKKR